MKLSVFGFRSLWLFVCFFGVHSFAQEPTAPPQDPYLQERNVDDVPLGDRLGEKIGASEYSFNIGLYSVEFLNGAIRAGAKWRYKVEPSYERGFFARRDTYRFTGGISPGDYLSEDHDIPFMFSIKDQREFTFVRQFRDQAEASLATPYPITKFPLTAGAALDLQPTDVAMFPAQMNINIGPELSYSEAGFTASARYRWFISGEFTVLVYRMAGNRVRVKLASHASDGEGFELKLQFRPTFSFFRVDLLDGTIERIARKDLIEFGWTGSEGSRFAVDYLYDLSTTQGRESYNAMLSSVYTINEAILAVKTKKIEWDGDVPLSKLFLVNYGISDHYHYLYKDLPAASRPVDRVAKGFSEYDRSNIFLGINLLFFKYESEETYTEEMLKMVDRDGKIHHIFHMTASNNKAVSWLPFGIGGRERTKLNMSVLSRANPIPKKDPEKKQKYQYKFDSLVIGYEYRDSGFCRDERDDVEKYLRKSFPKSFYNQIPRTCAWLGDGDLDDAEVEMTLGIHRGAFKLLRSARFSREEMAKILLDKAYRPLKKGERLPRTAKYRTHRLARNFLNGEYPLNFTRTIQLPNGKEQNGMRSALFEARRRVKGSLNQSRGTKAHEDEVVNLYQTLNRMELILYPERAQMHGQREWKKQVVSVPDQDRMVMLHELTKQSSFRNHGIGFLLGLLEAAVEKHNALVVRANRENGTKQRLLSVEDFLYGTYVAEARGEPVSKKKFGYREGSALYHQFQFILDFLNNTTADLRLTDTEIYYKEKSWDSPVYYQENQSGPIKTGVDFL